MVEFHLDDFNLNSEMGEIGDSHIYRSELVVNLNGPKVVRTISISTLCFRLLICTNITLF